MPNLTDSCRIVQLPASIRQLAQAANMSFPLSLRQFIANQQCPQSRCVRIHFKTMQQPNRPVKTMLLNMRRVYATADMGVTVGSRENLAGPAFTTLLDLDVGPCTTGTTTTEQNQLFQNRNNAGANDVVVYFARSVLLNNTGALNGCASFPAGSPGAAVAQIASPWTMGHEVGHVLGLNHISGEHTGCPPANPLCCSTPNFTRLMTGCGTGGITGIPTVSQAEINTMRASGFTFQC
jgi:Metallo-peptidase family M12B Reprolysin-like